MLFIDYGLESLQRAGGRTWQDVYDDTLALARYAEDAGFDGWWCTEHHFTNDGYLSGLFPMMAAVAATTSRLTIGTNIALAPLYNALRFAEDAAVVDLLSHGRLLLGVAIGYRDAEFDALGVPKRERVPRLRELVDVCRAAWTGEPFSYSGPTVDVRDLVVRPVPPGPPPLWLAGWVESAIRRAGEIGDGYISPAGQVDDTRYRIGILDEASEKVGRDAPLPIATATWVVVTDGRTTPQWAIDGIRHLYENYAEWYSSSSDDGGGHAVGEMIGQIRDSNRGGLPPGVVTGGPQEVLDQLAPLASEFSKDRDHRMAVRFHYPGMSRAQVVEHADRFVSEVLPGLRKL